jgi:hypothetical protein
MSNESIILNRRLDQLQRGGCDLANMQDFYGYITSENNQKTIHLQRESTNTFTLTVKVKKKSADVLQTYISELPRDMNNEIYSFLVSSYHLRYRLEIPDQYPFCHLTWIFEKYSKNGLENSKFDMDPNEMYCGQDHSPATTLDKEILMFISKIPWLSD